MAVGRRRLALLWALALALTCTQHTGMAHNAMPSMASRIPAISTTRTSLPSSQGPTGDPLGGVTIFPPLKTVPVVRALNPAHNGRVCSTWGDFHYKTFDGDIFRFPGLCNYVLASHCRAAYEDFNIQVRRSQEANATTPSRVVMKLDGMVLELTKSSVLVNSRPVQLPFSQSGVLIEKSNMYLKVVARLGLVFMWNLDDSLLLELDDKYANQTCGLCGDFNGLPIFNEFLSNNIKLTPTEYGNLQKLDGPMEQCQDPAPAPTRNCTPGLEFCQGTLLGQPFSGCHALVDASSYIAACQQDICLCANANPTSCSCPTLAEYARQCVHAGGVPQNWRTSSLCPAQACPFNMEHRECGLPCPDTCSNLERAQLCEDHCVSGCFCPQGLVFDDISQNGCVPVAQCSCIYNGLSYPPGAIYSTDCTNCTCSGGHWNCQEAPCPGTCSVLGGSHFTTFDEKEYTVHGDCSYVLAKPCDSGAFTVLAELRKCGLTDSETCLKSVTLSLGSGQTVIVVKASNEVFVNQIYTQLPVSAANVTLFRPSTFFIIAQTNLGLQLDIQLVPTMQVFLRLVSELRGLTCGLCGNFNSMQEDDFRTISGVVEGTAASFFNTWKTQAACPNVKNSFEDPCSLSVENEKYAQYWCSQLTDAKGPFAHCHASVNPATYYSNCMFDTCNCEKSEDCLCAALSAYVHTCAAKGVLLQGWRDGVCTKPATTCPKSLTYRDHISTCQPTCRSLSEEDVTCHISFVPVDGCVCAEGTYLDDSGKCVQATSCPCYYRGSPIPSGESVHDSGVACTCTQGKLTCIGGHAPAPVCTAPMVYFDCRNAMPGATGAGCQKSCHTLDMACYSPQCISGCVCPNGLVSDGEGSCIAEIDCPCVHNEASYKAGQTIHVGCNTCTCKNRMWQCTQEPCLATCTVYGDGHYITFDGQRFTFDGDCEYTLVQDHCGGNSSAQGSFHVVTENIPCGTTGTTCSKAIKIFLGSYELKLSGGKVEVIEKGARQAVPYSIRQMGIYLVVDTDAGLVFQWDKKTSLFLKLSPEFKGKVCGLCGNFDGNAINDFTTRSQSVVGDVLEFGNSWKFSPSCPDARAPRDPCTANPYRKSWAQKQCSILHGATFAACHAHVETTKYYEACVSDACACDSGGDCECFCTAVAAYAQACQDAGVCVSWRSPDVCPLFCDYYNPHGECEWHYQPCGAPCMQTCRNPSGRCLHDLSHLEGCYPKCPPEAPIFDEDEMQCVAHCPTPPPPPPCRFRGKDYRPGTSVPTNENCHTCICTENGVVCAYDAEACVCTYDQRHFRPGDVIYHTTDGTGYCLTAHCLANGTIEKKISFCDTSTAPTTTFFFSSTQYGKAACISPGSTVSTVTSNTFSTAPVTSPGSIVSTSPNQSCGEICQWTPWLDVSHPGRGVDSGDFDTLQNLRAHGFRVCQVPRAVKCRAENAPNLPLEALGQHVECSRTVGLICYNKDQASGLCDNYQIRVLCCSPAPCPTTSHKSAPTSTSATFRATQTTAGTKGLFTATSGPVHTASTTLSTASTAPATGTSAPAPGTSTPIKTSLLTPSPTPEATTETTSSTEPSKSPCLLEMCEWTKWLDGSYPEPGMNGGDFDTFHNLRAEGYKFCEHPKEVECRATWYPDTPLDELGQDVICNTKVGLLCLNKNQLPPICYNYEIRIRCCEVVDVCRTITPVVPSSVRTTTKTWVPKTIPTSQPTSMTTVSTTSSPVPTHSSIPVPTTTTPVPTTSSISVPTPSSTPTTHSRTITTKCRKRCTWTKWFDVDFPAPGPHGGDVETYENIIRHGETVCHRPEEITKLECRAENHPVVSIQQLGQVVECNPDVGLVCRNQDQKGQLKMCLNYEIRVLCCELPTPPPVASTVPGTSPVTATSSTASTTSVSTTSKPVCKSSSSTPRSTTAATTPSSLPATATTPAPTTTSAPTTTIPVPKTTTPVPTTTTSTPTTTIPVPKTTAPVPKTTITVPTTTSTTVPTTTTSPVPTTTPIPLSTTTPTLVPETTHSRTITTKCRKRCTWTKWFDVDFPAPGPHGGDVETYENIIRHGETVCHRPEEITKLECRAENHPVVSIQQLGQVVECNPDVGLVCRNQDQKGQLKMCLNYEIRVLCCELPTPPPVASTVPGTSPVTATSSTASTTSVSTTSKPVCKSSSSTPRSTTAATTPSSLPATATTPAPTTTSAPTTTIPVPKTTTPVPTTTTSTPTTTIPVPKTTAPVPKTTITVPTTTSTTVPTTTTSPVPTTTPIPLSTTTPTLVPETTHSRTITTKCRKRCTWTKWFDVDFPAPGPHGGDVETYENIIRHGETVCHRPEEITKLECRAENHPVVSIQQLGQVVECNPDVGLVCRNQDQKGKLKMCLNYEIRVLCCELPTPPPVASTVPGTSPVTATSSTASTTSVSTTSKPVCKSSSSTPRSTTATTTPSPLPPTTTTPVPTTTSAATTTLPVPTTTLPVHTSTLPVPTTTTIPTTPSPVPATTAPVPTTTSAPTTTLSVPTTTTPVSTITLPVHTTTTPVLITTTPVPTARTSVPTTTTHVSKTTTPAPATTPTSVPTIASTPTTHVPTTTPIPLSTTISTPVPETTHSQTIITTCPNQCTWTKWFDVDFPAPGPHGGDVETYENIIRHGEKVCHRPEEITKLECRAENHPVVSIQQLGQVVECNPDVGLVCRNQDQKGKLKMCLNYEIRVLCCEHYDGCPLTSVPPNVTSPTASTSPPESTSITATTSSPSPVTNSTTICYCFVANKLYAAGATIYQKKDLDGHCYHSQCTQDCHVVKNISHDCPRTTPAPTPETSPPPRCTNVVPPRKKGETWNMPNCTQAICEGNNVTTLHQRKCPRPRAPTCANGYPAVKVVDEDGCCHHDECQCVCSGWGDPHYITFDGTYYTFLDNCTYVLVQQIVPKYGHFRVLVDNYFCNAEDGLSCPHAIIIEYQQDRIVLTRKPGVVGVSANQIIFNGKEVHSGFSSNGVDIAQVGIKMYVSIPAIGLQVMFSGLIFSVELPFSKFANNTEGQCGTCSNNPKDDCRLPGGAVATSCSKMSSHWKVTMPDQPHCYRQPPTPLPTTPDKTKTTPTPCPPAPICQLILSKVFEPCHSVIPPWSYYEGCVFDQCHVTEVNVVCSSLEMYASICASHGVCIDWRGRTNNTCLFTCPADQVYQPCGPVNPPYCYGNNSASLQFFQDIGSFTEGCFCNEGLMLFSPSTAVCVPTGCPRCLGPSGEPVELDQTIIHNCQECTCESSTRTLACRTLTCPPAPNCHTTGHVLVHTPLKAGQCCVEYHCVCNASSCPQLAPCPRGSHLVQNPQEGECCPSQKCIYDACVVNGSLYQPGAVVSSDLCKTCKCQATDDPETEPFVVTCETLVCKRHCPVGFEYRVPVGQCCGSCVQVACVVNTSDGSPHLFYPGQTWSEPGNRCETHECEKYQDGVVVVTTRKACPALRCPQDQAVPSEDGCCLSCPQQPPQNRSTCTVYDKQEVIRVGSCSTTQPVRLTYCQGNCGDTISMYSFEASMVEHRCKCCQELRTSLRNVTLSCQDGSTRAFSYRHIEECGCVGPRCDTLGNSSHSELEPEQSKEEESQETRVGRWSRGLAPATPVH
ncbi:mucin-5AC [Loxodonta africana]|uniref:mucin-5AC n=1 Tax=Loxodonta africana TaxID=9785 RepID=UPI0030D18FC3